MKVVDPEFTLAGMDDITKEANMVNHEGWEQKLRKYPLKGQERDSCFLCSSKRGRRLPEPSPTLERNLSDQSGNEIKEPDI